MRLIVFSPEKEFEGEHNLVNSFFEKGLETFHVRKPFFSKKEMEDYLRKFPTVYYSKMILHSHYELCDLFGLKGKHKRGTHKAWDQNYVTAACHSLSALTSCKNKGLDYVFLSPIFDSISKEGYRKGFNRDALKKTLNQKLGIDVMALGGITKDKVEMCMKMGFDGVAVLGSIWKSESPLTSFLALKSVCEDFKMISINEKQIK